MFVLEIRWEGMGLETTVGSKPLSSFSLKKKSLLKEFFKLLEFSVALYKNYHQRAGLP